MGRLLEPKIGSRFPELGDPLLGEDEAGEAFFLLDMGVESSRPYSESLNPESWFLFIFLSSEPPFL